MKIIRYLCLAFVFWAGALSFAQADDLVIDDFERVIIGNADGTVDFGAGGGSSVEVIAATDIKNCGKQSLKVTYNAVPGGYIWVARGFGLDVNNTQWLVRPEDIDWSKYNAIAFYMYGSGSKAKIAFDIKDNGNELWRYMFEDNFKGWKRIVCLFNEFFCRGDWQPQAADKNASLNFPIKSFQFEPRPPAKGTLYFDCVELIKQ